MNFRDLLNDFYIKHKNLIHLNKNFLIAGIISAIVDMAVVTYSSIIFLGNNLLISILSLTADFLIYNLVFIVLFYFDNRERYLNNDGTKNKQRLRLDSLKLVITLGLSEISYLFTKFISTYLFFKYTQINSTEISLITTITGWIIYATTANIMIIKTRFFN